MEGFGGFFNDPDFQRRMQEMAEQMQASQSLAWADNAIKLAVDMTVAAINRVNIQGTTEQQAQQIRAVMATVFPEAVTLVREARRVHDVCAANGVPVWCGGMLETGLGRAANVALAALPGFVLPGDTSASRRYYAHDLTEPFELDDGHLVVPTGPGVGREPLPAALAECTTAVQEVPLP